ncbi:MAG: hypothetical protein H7222_15265 [Methylotenera sp.]|nr:hypothetical protein [Oligoflexia bacterium]
MKIPTFNAVHMFQTSSSSGVVAAVSMIAALALITGCNVQDPSALSDGHDNSRLDSAFEVEHPLNESSPEHPVTEAEVQSVAAGLLAQSDQFLFDAARNHQLGACVVSDHRLNSRTFCDYYVFSAAVGSMGLKGYPKNPHSGDSTGCVVAPLLDKGVNICWDGYDAATMCTDDAIKNAAGQLRKAISDGVCNLPVSVPVPSPGPSPTPTVPLPSGGF